MTTIATASSRDVRFRLRPGEGSDSVHSPTHYAYAVSELRADNGLLGTGLAFTLGDGTELVCAAMDALARELEGREIEELMADWAATSRRIADHSQYRWLGPHKGVVHLALAGLTNACFDLWAKSRGLPLWRLLLDLSPSELVALLDLSYLEDVLTPEGAIALLEAEAARRPEREGLLLEGYPGYDTSMGWFAYSDAEIRDRARRAVALGFGAVKLKVGGDEERDVRRAMLLRDVLGPDTRIMVDANQQWSVPQAIRVCGRLAAMAPFWVEEPTHPDDVLGHQHIARSIAPTAVAAGEHVPNRVVFKNLLQADAIAYVQADVTRLGGVSEFLAVSLLARVFGKPVVPHVGDMGQIHQHLVLFNRIALGHDVVFLESIPHLRDYFVTPALLRDGRYVTTQEPGASSDLRDAPGDAPPAGRPKG